MPMWCCDPSRLTFLFLSRNVEVPTHFSSFCEADGESSAADHVRSAVAGRAFTFGSRGEA